MAESVIQRSFSAGELAPALHARADLGKYTTGLRTCRNFVVRREGGASLRPGTRYVNTCKTASATVQLMRYVSEIAGESLLIENGAGYFRFYEAGGLVEVSAPAAWSGATAYVIGDIVASGGVNYYCVLAHTNQVPPNATYWYAMPADNILELPCPFGADLPNWDAQNGNVITLTHPDHAPAELVYLGLTTWIIRTVVTEPAVEAPTGLGGVAGAAGTRSFLYVVTAAAGDTYEESNPSGSVLIAGAAEPTPDAPNVLSWTPVAGAAEYYVYLDPYLNGTLGFVGTATGAPTFNDTGFIPDFAVTPPIPRTLFNTLGVYPAHSAYFQQRRFFGHTRNLPDSIEGSRIGFHSNFGIASPLQDDDAIALRLAGNQQNPVRFLIGLKTLIVGTDAGVWTVGEVKQPLTPNNLPADQETYAGVSDVKPAIVGNSLLYVQARGTLFRDLRFDQEVEGLAGRDLTIFAGHLFGRGKTLERVDFQAVPHSIAWCVRSDGVLLGLTYVREQDIVAWHRHDTGAGGLFEDICVVPENDEDVLYAIVRRGIDGVVVRYIERLERLEMRDGFFDEDCFFVDCGLSYSGAPANNFSGLEHLEGEVVAVVGDGAVVYNGDPAGADAATYTVTGGEITLPADYSNVHIGLRIENAELETLDLDVQGSSLRDKKKRIASVALLLERSARTFSAGPDATHLRTFTRQAWEAAEDEHTGQVTMSLTSEFNLNGRILIRQTDPLPLTVIGILPIVETGG